MEKQTYRPRIIDQKIEEYLSAFGAVCVEGPKWCGKTWTSAHHSNSEIYLGDPAGNFQNRELARLSPDLVLNGETPRLIDEWQEVPSLWDAVRHRVDQIPAKGQFILTGSATPNHKGILHSGAGRPIPAGQPPRTIREIRWIRSGSPHIWGTSSPRHNASRETWPVESPDSHRDMGHMRSRAILPAPL